MREFLARRSTFLEFLFGYCSIDAFLALVFTKEPTAADDCATFFGLLSF